LQQSGERILAVISSVTDWASVDFHNPLNSLILIGGHCYSVTFKFFAITKK